MVGGGLLCALITLILGQNIGIIVLCIFWVFLQFAYAMLSVPLTSAISERVPDKFRPRIERWHGIGVMLGQALGVCMGALGVMFNSFAPFSYTAVLFAVSGIATVLILPKEPSSAEQRTSFLTAVRYLTNCARRPTLPSSPGCSPPVRA